jgi:5-methyltetrahydropteroyltriglutamate--homocysteine methyltransferase
LRSFSCEQTSARWYRRCRRRADGKPSPLKQAAKYVALDQLCLSLQCGFASTEEGNIVSEDEQWAKLRMIVEIAEEVWGKV